MPQLNLKDFLKVLSDTKSYKKGCVPYCPVIKDGQSSIQCCSQNACNTGTGIFGKEPIKTCYYKAPNDKTEISGECASGSSVCYVKTIIDQCYNIEYY
jgi:hypothetical protein